MPSVATSPLRRPTAVQNETSALRREVLTLRRLHCELIHRQANQLDLAYQLLQFRRRESPVDHSPGHSDDTLAEVASQLLALRYVNQQINATSQAPVCLARLLRDLTEALRAASSLDFALSLDLTPLEVTSHIATRVALAVHELLINSLKYGLPETGGGLVALRLKKQLSPKRLSTGWQLDYADSGVGAAPAKDSGARPSSTKQGLTLTRLLLSDISAELQRIPTEGQGRAYRISTSLP